MCQYNFVSNICVHEGTTNTSVLIQFFFFIETRCQVGFFGYQIPCFVGNIEICLFTLLVMSFQQVFVCSSSFVNIKCIFTNCLPLRENINILPSAKRLFPNPHPNPFNNQGLLKSRFWLNYDHQNLDSVELGTFKSGF